MSFTVNGQTYLTIASGVIGNQTLELVIYFEPNTYELTYVTGDPTDPDAGKWVGAGDSSPATQFGYELNLPKNETLAVVTRTGYELRGWTTVETYSVRADGTIVTAGTDGLDVKEVVNARGQEALDVITWLGTLATGNYYAAGDLFKMPARDVNLYAVWTPTLTNYFVNRYSVARDGSVTLIDSENRTAPTHTMAEATDADKVIVGQFYRAPGSTAPASIESALVTPDGLATIQLYFDVTADTEYTVEFLRYTGTGLIEPINAFKANATSVGGTDVYDESLPADPDGAATNVLLFKGYANTRIYVDQAGTDTALVYYNNCLAKIAADAITGYAYNATFSVVIDGKTYTSTPTGIIGAGGALKLTLVFDAQQNDLIYDVNAAGDEAKGNAGWVIADQSPKPAPQHRYDGDAA